MTDKELAAIKARWNWILTDALPSASEAKADIRALVAEVEALRRLIVGIEIQMAEARLRLSDGLRAASEFFGDEEREEEDEGEEAGEGDDPH